MHEVSMTSLAAPILETGRFKFCDELANLSRHLQAFREFRRVRLAAPVVLTMFDEELSKIDTMVDQGSP
jgi:hypothetical protein